jgi:hypothetical protein
MNPLALTADRILRFRMETRNELPVRRFQRAMAKATPALIVIADSHEPTIRSVQPPCQLVAEACAGWDYVYYGNARFGVTLCAESLEELPSEHSDRVVNPVLRYALPAFPHSVVEIDGSIANRAPVIRVMARTGTP